MEAIKNGRIDESKRQTELRRQIAQLQAELHEAPELLPLSPKRNESGPTVLAPATPSPKKRKIQHERPDIPLKPLIMKPKTASKNQPVQRPNHTCAPTPPASTFLSDLGSISTREMHEAEPVPRSSAFSEQPVVSSDIPRNTLAQDRDERLALVEELETGPAVHKAPFDDPHFEKIEPNSGIHLASRKLPHDDLQEYLRGRFFLSPSRLYSIIRLLPNRQGYDVPVAGDWVTIAVVAERSPIRLTSGNGPATKDDDDDDKPSGAHAKKRKNEDAHPKKPVGKKYMNIKLVDFGHRSKSSSTAKATIKGDALLSLLLFESDSFDRIKDENGAVKKLYKGGSRGAFEELAKLREGTVVALLNPRVLKPFQKSSESPHPTNNILALSPESAQSIAVIGHARDLGMCSVLKRDGKVCGGWCDKRVSDVCEFHVQTAVQSRRAARPEFSMGTSGMSTTSAGKRKSAYDPARQWGLKPSDKSTGDGETYVFSGHVVSSKGPEYVHETMGREGQSRAKRKLEEKEADKKLQLLLSKDRGGVDGAGEVVKRARLAAKSKANFTSLRQMHKEKEKGMKRDEEQCEGSDEASTSDGLDTRTPSASKLTFPPEMVKRLGFDPTLKIGQKRLDNKPNAKKLSVPQSKVHLGPPPGPRIRSGVTVPQLGKKSPGSPEMACGQVDSIMNDDEDLERAEKAILGRVLASKASTPSQGSLMADNCDSDSDLEVEAPF